jgi:cyclopropane fatty-acyl-phospholipid synthase-like methyltransferase
VKLKAVLCSINLLRLGLVQLITEPVTYYKEVIRAVAYSPEMKEFRIKQFADFVNKYSLEGKKIIEIGAGKGEYLDLLKTTGVDCYGLEFSPDSVTECNSKNLNVNQGFIENEDYKIANGPFDAFLNISFFEHLPEPNQILRGIYNNLTDGAIGLVEVPNFDMILRDKLFSEFMRDHLFYFTKSTLSTTLELNGFEVLNAQEVWHDYILSFEVRKKSPTNLNQFIEHKTKIQNDIESFLNSNKSVAIWGAGHQAFAIMSIMQLGGKIKYIVDSAKFKQGKFSPATHIPILPPETLNTDPVEAIIIMTGSYSDEVKKIVKEKHPNLNTAILRDNGLELE